jgi:hypothetical protein
MSQNTEHFPHTLDMDEFTHKMPPHANKPEALAHAEGQRDRRKLSRILLVFGLGAPVVFLALLLLADMMNAAPVLSP